MTTSCPTEPRALYSWLTGRRLDPTAGRAPADGQPVAVMVLDDGTSAHLVEDSVIGRDPDIDRRVRRSGATPVLIDDPSMMVSRCHAMLRIRGWRIDVIDLGSQNGTFVELDLGDGRPDTNDGWTRCVPGLAHTLRVSGRIRLGERTLSVHPLAPVRP